MILTIINSNDSCSSNPLINISGITMSVLPNNIKCACQTTIYNIPVCHTHISTCKCLYKFYNACQQSNRCGCTVGKLKKNLPIVLPSMVEAENFSVHPRIIENCNGETCRHIWDNNIKVDIRQILLL